MPFFSRAFWSRESSAAKRQARQKANAAPAKPQWTDAWQRTEVSAEEVQELLRGCTQELKSRGSSIVIRIQPIGIGLTGGMRISSRHSLPPPSISTQLGPECGTHVHSELLQCGPKRLPPNGRGFDAGATLDGTDGRIAPLAIPTWCNSG